MVTFLLEHRPFKILKHIYFNLKPNTWIKRPHELEGPPELMLNVVA